MTPMARRLAAVGLVVLASACSDGEGEPSASDQPSPSATVTATGSPSGVPTSRLSPRAGCSDAQVGVMRICPASGPVGSTVTIEGIGCSAFADGGVTLVFDNEGATPGTRGAVELPHVTQDAERRFRLTWTVPRTLHSLQGEGGGAVRPGSYNVAAKPPTCVATFTVTG